MSNVRFVFRALAIFALVLFTLARFFVGWTVLVVLLQGKQQRQEWFGRCVVGLFRGLGATFVKVGQIMSTRPDLFPPHVIRALELLQDNVGPFAYEEVQRTFVAEFGKLPEELFAEISPVPIASASVAQVHKARLKDGRVVAVKVRRPKLDELVAFDLKVMRGFAHAMALVPSIRRDGAGRERRRVRPRHQDAARLHHRGAQQPPSSPRTSRTTATSSSPRSSTGCARRAS